MCALNDIKDFTTICALAVGIWVGLNGLQTWKKQLKGNHEYSLAKNILLNTYKYREALFQLRHPAIWNYEYPHLTQEELRILNQSEKKYRQTAYVYQKRWEKISELKPLLIENILESQVVWDDELKKYYTDLFKIEFDIQQNISAYLEKLNPYFSSEGSNIDRSLIYDSLQESDPVRSKTNPIILKIEDYLKPKIKIQFWQPEKSSLINRFFQFIMLRIR